MNHTRKHSEGFMTVAVVIGFTVITLISAAVLSVAAANHQVVQRDAKLGGAQLAIDGAISEALVELEDNASWTGTSGDVNFHTHGNIRVTYATTVTTPAPQKRKLTVTAKIFQPSTASSPTETRKAVVDLAGQPAVSPYPNNFAVLSGSGGLQLSTSSGIVGGPVYSNGKIGLTTNAHIGSSASPQKVYTSHQACGQLDGTYPRVCASGEAGEPIELSTGGTIYGEVRATNQVNGSGMVSPGLIANSTAPVVTLPEYDRAGHIAAVTSTLSSSAASCSMSATKTWAANVRITGDVSGSTSCRITVSGNAWIEGDLDLGTSARMTVAESATVPPVLMVDGSGGVELGTGTGLYPNSAGVGFRVISYYAAGCGACSSVSPSVLANNIDREMIDIGTDSTVTHAELYARWGKVDISTGSAVGAVIGQTVSISTGGAVPFTRSVTDFVPPSTSSAWKVVSYRRDY